MAGADKMLGHLAIGLARARFARGMVMRDHQRCGADVEPAAENFADLKRRLVDRAGEDLLMHQMVLRAEIEHSHFLVTGMAAAAAQVIDHCGLVGDQRARFDIAAQDMADDVVDALQQLGGAAVAGGRLQRESIGGENRAERAVAVEQPVGGLGICRSARKRDQFVQEGSAPLIAVRRQWNAVPAVSTMSWMSGQLTTITI